MATSWRRHAGSDVVDHVGVLPPAARGDDGVMATTSWMPAAEATHLVFVFADLQSLQAEHVEDTLRS
ncbi:hypothetical protein GUJ93_ZPchr0003g17381 [Zizania palustris]|uniref:Uncharacterized protein n=1 Tax=Zizania palustris TaxID=103762 RepID=A0A8J5RQD4_ZIZPA|nr:hypothetical protein GUJ93_ZPchr0003g17381 [Zizania palustris]